MERKKNPERHTRGYTFRGGSQRIGPADLYIFRAQTKKRWAQDIARGFRLGIRTIRVPKKGPGSQYPWDLVQLPLTGTPKITGLNKTDYHVEELQAGSLGLAC